MLKTEKMMQIASKAEVGEDKWLFAKLGAAAGSCARKQDSYAAAVEIERRVVDALGEIGQGEPTERRDDEERLELEVLNKVFGAMDPADYKYAERLAYLVETPASDKIIAVKAFAIWYTATPYVSVLQRFLWKLTLGSYLAQGPDDWRNR